MDRQTREDIIAAGGQPGAKQSGDGRVYTGGARRSVEEGGKAQCDAMRTTSNTGARCNKDALPNTDPPRCENHVMNYEAKSTEHMHRFYGRQMRPALKAAVQELIEGLGVVEQLDLSEELALVRHQTGNLVEVYSAAVEGNATLETRVAAGAVMVESVKDVIKAVESMAHVEEVKLRVSGTFAGAMHSVVVAVVKAVNEVFQDDYRVPEFERVLRERLLVHAAGSGEDGTVLTPDQDVIEMDELIPKG
jgi:hypothetical protein